jgi:hypothetical protein
MKPVRYDEDADEELIDEIARYELRRAASRGRTLIAKARVLADARWSGSVIAISEYAPGSSISRRTP